MIGKSTQAFIWLLLFIGWVFFSASYHPTLLIDVIATFILLSAYAGIVYLNFLALVPKFWITRKYLFYWLSLAASMCVLTFSAFSLIRMVYTLMWDPEQLGDYWQHFLIDFFGMSVHLCGAVIFVMLAKKMNRRLTIDERRPTTK